MKELNDAEKLEYRLLARLQMDCLYYLGAGGRHKKHLWAQDEVTQIQKMKDLYAGLPEKPEWITLEDIAQYEAAMTRKTIYCLAYVDRAGDGVDQYDSAEERAKHLGKTGENEVTFEVTVAINADAESIEDAIDIEFVKHRNTPLVKLEEQYLEAASAYQSKLTGDQNYHDELHAFIDARDKLREHPEFKGPLPKTYFSGGDLDPEGQPD